MDFIKLADAKLKNMKELLSTGGGLALYPFGMEAKAVKSLLEVHYGITPVLLLDNFLCKEFPDKVRGLDALSEQQYQDIIVLVVSDLPTIHDDLLEKLYAVYPKEKCIDLLKESYEAWHHFPDTLSKMLQSGMMENGMVYHPEKTKASFFLPFAQTDEIQKCLLLKDDYFECGLLTKIFKTFDDGRISRAVRGRTIVDIGANIGNHSLYFALEAGARKVVSFEPVPMTFAILKRNVELNRLGDRIELHNCGLGKEDSHAVVPVYNTINTGGTMIKPGAQGDIIVRKLDEMDLPDDIALVKIDVEGMEYDVVLGAVETLKKQHPIVMMESWNANAPKMIKFMSQLGYQCEQMDAQDYVFY